MSTPYVCSSDVAAATTTASASAPRSGRARPASRSARAIQKSRMLDAVTASARIASQRFVASNAESALSAEVAGQQQIDARDAHPPQRANRQQARPAPRRVQHQLLRNEKAIELEGVKRRYREDDGDRADLHDRNARLPTGLGGATSTTVMTCAFPPGRFLALMPEEEKQRDEQRRGKPLPVRFKELGEGTAGVRTHMNGPAVGRALHRPFSST